MAQRRMVQGAFGRHGTTLFDEISADRQQSLAEQEAQRQARRAEAIVFRHRQVSRAKTNALYTQLKEHSIAKKIADAAFDVWAEIEVPRNSQHSRTELAYMAALARLGKTHEDGRRSGAIRFGKFVVRETLAWAYKALMTEVVKDELEHV